MHFGLLRNNFLPFWVLWSLRTPYKLQSDCTQYPRRHIQLRCMNTDLYRSFVLLVLGNKYVQKSLNLTYLFDTNLIYKLYKSASK